MKTQELVFWGGVLRMERGQVWVETVLYTLIGLALIALVLAFVTPKINQSRDKIIVEQTINSLNEFDEKIGAVLSAPGNFSPSDLRPVKTGIAK